MPPKSKEHEFVLDVCSGGKDNFYQLIFENKPPMKCAASAFGN
jgi:hypothetical protein